MMTMLLVLVFALAPQDPQIAKAEKVLTEKPDDAAANQTLGIYYAGRAEWDKAVPHFLKSKQDLLRAAAEKETKDDGNKFTAVEIGDAWLTAGPKAATAHQACVDRASYWYLKAWPMLEVAWREVLRKKLGTLYSPYGGARGGALPPGWGGSADTKVKVQVDSTRVHAGGAAVRITPPPTAGLREVLSSGTQVAQGKVVEFTAWMMSDETDTGGDKVQFNVVGPDGKLYEAKEFTIGQDTPIWQRLSFSLKLPDGACKVKTMVLVSSTKGFVYVDDISIKVDGRELVPAGNFEGK